MVWRIALASLVCALGACREPSPLASGLTLDRGVIAVQPGGFVTLHVSRGRSGAPIPLSIVGAPAGVSADEVILAADQPTVALTVRAATGAPYTAVPASAALMAGDLALPITIDVVGAPGQHDLTFGTGGIAIVGLPAARCALDVSPAGGIVVASGRDADVSLAELDVHGAPKPGFRLSTAPQGTEVEVTGVRVGADDVRMLVVHQRARDGVGTELAFARLAPDGTPAVGFGMAGWARAPLPAISAPVGIPMEVSGSGDTYYLEPGSSRVSCISRTGQACDRWGGFSGAIVDGRLYGITMRGDGRLLAAGYRNVTVSEPAFLLAGFLSDGTPDPTVGDGGARTIPFARDHLIGDQVTVLPDDRLLLSGIATDPGGADTVAAARLSSAGVIDPGFGTNGQLQASLDTGNDLRPGLSRTLVQGDGRVVVIAIEELARARLFRFDADGKPDPTFSPVDVSHPFGNTCGARLQPTTGRLVLGTVDEAGSLLVERFWL